ncbi:MAG TPA: M23 family metallopeptidase [Paenibacillaceae bacterium]
MSFLRWYKRLMYLGAVLTGLFYILHRATDWKFACPAMNVSGLFTLVLAAFWLLLFRKAFMHYFALLPADLVQAYGEWKTRKRYGAGLPLPDTYRQANRYALPFAGTWTVANGGPDPETSHSWFIVGQRFAYDFLITDEDGKTHRGDGRRLEDYYAFGAPVLAPADGVVVKARDGRRDYSRPGHLAPFVTSLLGNYVIIDHGGGEYSLLAHLRRGSVRVKPGDRVTRGQIVGEAGNSGNSSEPHLHFHVQDSPRFPFSASLPVRFSGYRRLVREGGVQREETVEEGFPVRGERVIG